MHFSLLLEDGKTSVELPVRLGRRRKSIALKFESNRPVIDVPKHLREAQIEKLLSANHAWLRRAYRKWQMSEASTITPHQSGEQACEYFEFGSHAGERFCQAFNVNRPFSERNEYLSEIEFSGKKLAVDLRLTEKDTGRSKLANNGFECVLNAKHWRNFKTAFEKRWCSMTSKRMIKQPTKRTEAIDPERFLLASKQIFWQALWQIKLEQSPVMHPDSDLSESRDWLMFVHQSSSAMTLSVMVQLKNLSDSRRFSDWVQTQPELEVWLNWTLNWILSCVVGELYKSCLTGYLQSNLPRLANTMNLDYRRFEVRSYKSRWGSCKSDASLQFNWRIAQADLTVIDSLIIHELAHLQHPNHSANFWRLVKHYDANFFASEKLFKTAGKRWIQFLNIAYR